jgi:hypothetical protein
LRWGPGPALRAQVGRHELDDAVQIVCPLRLMRSEDLVPTRAM